MFVLEVLEECSEKNYIRSSFLLNVDTLVFLWYNNVRGSRT